MVKKEKLKDSLLILIFFIIALIFLIHLINEFRILDNEEFLVKFFISNETGFDLTPDYLGFGAIQEGQTASRKMILRNDFNKKVKMSIYASKEINDFLRISENDFYLLPNEQKNLSISIYALKGFELGEYNGKLNVLTKRF